jgi:cell division protein FtsQ
MTRASAEPARNRRVVAAPKEESTGLQGGGQDSPAPPVVGAPAGSSAAARRIMRGDAISTISRVVLTGLILGGSSAAVVLGTYHFAQTSSRFAVRQIDVDGLRHKSREAVLVLGGLSPGKNIFSVDTAAAERAILVDPWFREVKIERRLPATIRIELVEREAGALAIVGDQMLVVSRMGEPFKKFETGDPADLPLITGVAVEEPGRDPLLERRRILTALEVLRHYERTSIARVHAAEEVHMTPGGDAILTVGKSAIALHLGAGPWAKKLAMAERILGKLRGQKGAVAAVFLDNRAHPERVVVRMH